jgi:hypothetical protein
MRNRYLLPALPVFAGFALLVYCPAMAQEWMPQPVLAEQTARAAEPKRLQDTRAHVWHKRRSSREAAAEKEVLVARGGRRTIEPARAGNRKPLVRLHPEPAEPTTEAAPQPRGRNLAGDLVPGTPTTFELDPVDTPTLFTGDYAYRVRVPEGATRLQVLLKTQTPGADLDLYIRYGDYPRLQNGELVAEWVSEGLTGDEVITINSPRAGDYFVAFGVWTFNVPVRATVTATIERPAPPPAQQEPAELVPNTPAWFRLPAVSGPTLFTGANLYRFEVSSGTTRFEVRLNTTTPNADVDLYVRRGAPPTVVDGRIVADYYSEGPDGNEFIAVSAASDPALQPGVYFAALALFSPGVAVEGSLELFVQHFPEIGQVLLPNTTVTVDLPAVRTSTLFHGGYTYRVLVPEGANRLQIDLETDNLYADIVVLARYGDDVAIEGNRLAFDHSSTGPAGAKQIVITSQSSAPLRPGMYYIAFGLYTMHTPVRARLTATLNGAGLNTGTALISGLPFRFSLPQVEAATLFHGDYSFRIDVPNGAARLRVRLLTETPATDLDLFVRYGQDVDLVDRRVIADYFSTSDGANQEIVISGPALRPGRYFISLANFTPAVEATGLLVAAVEWGSGSPD